MTTPRLLPAPGTPIGYLSSGKPVYPVIGGSSDAFDVEPDDADTEEEEELDDADDDTPDDGKGKYVPPSRAEWLKVQASLTKANAQAKQRREALADREKKLQELQDKDAEREADAERRALLDGARPKKKAAEGGGGAPAPVLPDGVLTKAQVRQQMAQATREAEERTASKFRGIAVNQAARAALASSGVQTSNVSRLVRLLDLDEVQIDDDGEIVEGLDEQIEALKADLPQLFRPAEAEKPKPRRAPAPRVSASDRAAVEERPRTTADQMAAAILGSR